MVVGYWGGGGDHDLEGCLLVWVFVEVVVVIVIRWIFLVRSGCGCRTRL